MTEVKVKKESTDPVDIENRWVQHSFNMRSWPVNSNLKTKRVDRFLEAITVNIRAIL